MKIKTEELRKFLNAAGNIAPNPLALYLDSILIECTGNEIIFTKTNNNISCRYSYVCQPQPKEKFLINERMLNGVALTSSEYEFSIDEYGVNIRITDGDAIIKSKRQDHTTFPKMQDGDGDKIKIDQDTVKRIVAAGKFVAHTPLKTNMCYVNISAEGVFAFDLQVAYYYKADGLPQMLLDQEPINVLKTSDDVFYWTAGNFDFFQFDGFTFSFIKTTVKLLPFMDIVNQPKSNSFSIKKIDLVNFCTLAQYVKQKDYAIAKLFTKPGDNSVLNVKFVDARYDIDIDKNYAIESFEPVPEFAFNIDAMALLLKNLPYEILTFTNQSGHYAVTSVSDEGYKGIVARLQA